MLLSLPQSEHKLFTTNSAATNIRVMPLHSCR